MSNIDDPYMVLDPPTASALTAEIERLATEYPDTRYVRVMAERSVKSVCQYLAGEVGPGVGCIFGQALINLGFPREILEKADQVGASIYRLAETWDVPQETREWWAHVQRTQDMGATWRDAVMT